MISATHVVHRSCQPWVDLLAPSIPVRCIAVEFAVHFHIVLHMCCCFLFVFHLSNARDWISPKDPLRTPPPFCTVTVTTVRCLRAVRWVVCSPMTSSFVRLSLVVPTSVSPYTLTRVRPWMGADVFVPPDTLPSTPFLQAFVYQSH